MDKKETSRWVTTDINHVCYLSACCGLDYDDMIIRKIGDRTIYKFIYNCPVEDIEMKLFQFLKSDIRKYLNYKDELITLRKRTEIE